MSHEKNHLVKFLKQSTMRLTVRPNLGKKELYQRHGEGQEGS